MMGNEWEVLLKADLTPLIIQEVLDHFLGEMALKSLQGFNINFCL